MNKSSDFTHSHKSSEINIDNESRILKVVILTALTMIVEIAVGYITGSMALLADGWHMGTHTFALGISYSAYLLARKYDNSEVFSFGTGKFGILAGYTSALMLGVTAVWLIYESVVRIISPVTIDFINAILVTVIGLLVNLASVLLLHQGEHHGHHHDHEGHSHHHHDHNYRAAYFHVLADALTSVLALIALLAGYFMGWVFLDPVIGILGGIMIARWAWGLLCSTGIILLDGSAEARQRDTVKRLIESDNDSRVADLHLWRIGSENMAAIITVVSGANRNAAEYHQRLKDKIPKLSHLSIEVHPQVS